ncbi:MAG TPA: hypothetical protein VFE30_14440 [Anaeromyxobacteraceae bacterium]|jgi:hypothetical protein|nr:hypothetical protein [Anaeromyxobacteraceae bacterium]
MPGKDTTEAVTAPSEDRVPAPAARPLAARQALAVAAAAPPVLSRAPTAGPVGSVTPASELAAAPQAPKVAVAPPLEAPGADALRLRLAACTEALRAGGPLDRTAVDALLGEADRVLSELTALASSLPKEARAELSARRVGLLDAAFALTAELQRLAPAEAPPVRAELPRPVPAAPAAPAGAAFEPVDQRRARRGWLLPALGLISLLAAGGYHGSLWLQRQEAQRKQAASSALPGVPEGLNALGQPDGRVVLMPQPGRHVDRAQLERFRSAQADRGWTLTDLGQGAWMVEPR